MEKSKAIEYIQQCLDNAREAASGKIERLVSSGCLDLPSCDMVDLRALTASLMEYEVRQLSPPASYKRRFNKVKRNADCF